MQERHQCGRHDQGPGTILHKVLPPAIRRPGVAQDQDEGEEPQRRQDCRPSCAPTGEQPEANRKLEDGREQTQPADARHDEAPPQLCEPGPWDRVGEGRVAVRREEPEVEVDQRPAQEGDGEDHPHYRAVPTHGTVTDSHCQKSAHPDGSCSPQADARAAKSLISTSRPRHLTLLLATMRQSELMHVLCQKPARTLFSAVSTTRRRE